MFIVMNYIIHRMSRAELFCHVNKSMCGRLGECGRKIHENLIIIISVSSPVMLIINLICMVTVFSMILKLRCKVSGLMNVKLLISQYEFGWDQTRQALIYAFLGIR